jgi:hypothetical protein
VLEGAVSVSVSFDYQKEICMTGNAV